MAKFTPTEGERYTINSLLQKMPIEEKIGHLLCWFINKESLDEIEEIARKVPVGSIFLKFCSPQRIREVTEVLNRHNSIPILVASDLDRGAGPFIEGMTSFPFMMALGSTNSEELSRKTGRATAREGRSNGIHWTFSPVVDLNINFQNPIVNVRAFGEDPDHVSRMATSYIEGIQQDELMAATAKHFPGDGLDDRDQHLCTSINPFSRDEWNKVFGPVWRQVIDHGVMSIMSGHIALPSVDPGSGDYRGPPPATLSADLQTKLLKDELGFEGVVVSDAYPMIGFTSHLPPSRLAVENIRSGSDVLLFAEPERDASLLLEAVRNGELSQERVDDATRRVLLMKERLGLLRGRDVPSISGSELESHKDWSREVAERSITIVRDAKKTLPLQPKAGAKLLTISITYDATPPKYQDVLIIDEELRTRGFEVDHLVNPSHNEILSNAADYEVIFVNFNVTPHAVKGTIRVCDPIFSFWRSFWLQHPRVVFTSFGNPYTLYEMPSVPNMINAYSNTPSSQRAAVKAWLGEIAPNAQNPVSLPGYFARNV